MINSYEVNYCLLSFCFTTIKCGMKLIKAGITISDTGFNYLTAGKGTTCRGCNFSNRLWLLNCFRLINSSLIIRNSTRKVEAIKKALSIRIVIHASSKNFLENCYFNNFHLNLLVYLYSHYNHGT